MTKHKQHKYTMATDDLAPQGTMVSTGTEQYTQYIIQ